MFKKILLLGILFLTTPVFASTICIEIPDAQMPYVQAVAVREGAESAETYIQRVVTSAVNSWQKQIDDEKLQKMKEMLQALSSTSQAELVAALQAKSQQEGIMP